MQFREIGKTGVRVGTIGLGCEHLDRKPYAQVKETIDAALEAGITHTSLCRARRCGRTLPRRWGNAARR